MRAVVIGASGGIGKALVKRLSAQKHIETIYALSRSPCDIKNEKIIHKTIDITDESSIKNAATSCEGPLDLIIVATGMLSNGDTLPEKSLRDLDIEAMQTCFTINTFGPALIAKHFLPRISKEDRSVFVCLSARVGSTSDNRLGGWYSYRASKAALNMIIKSTSIETARRYKQAVIVGLHPGTVDTELSKPFQSNVKHHIFAAEQAAGHLLDIIDKVKPEDSGKCFAWDGKEIIP